MGLKDRVGLLKLGTTWPLPTKLVKKYLSMTDKILIVEEVFPFLEENIKILAAEEWKDVGNKTFYGKREGTIPRRVSLTRILWLRRSPKSWAFPMSPRSRNTKKAPSVPLPPWPNGISPCARAVPTGLRSGASIRLCNWTTRKGFVCGDMVVMPLAYGPPGTVL